MPKINKKGINSKYKQQNLLLYYTSETVSSKLHSDIRSQINQNEAESSSLESQSASPKSPSSATLQSASSSTSQITPQALPTLLNLEPSAISAALPSESPSQLESQSVQSSNSGNIIEENEQHYVDRNTQYKKKVIQMSCILSKKSIQLNELKEKNYLLKSTLNKIQDKSECNLSAEDMQALLNLPTDQSSDMTFVRKAILYFYKNDISQLRFKSLMGSKSRMIKLKSGTVVQKEAKERLSPEKVHQIKTLFGKRVDFQGERFALFNRHVTNSITKIQERLANAERTQKSAINDGI